MGFAGIIPELVALSHTIVEPGFNLRAMATSDDLRAALPAGWAIGPPSFAMMGPSQTPPVGGLPDGYRLELRSEGAAVHAFVTDASGELAAHGHGGAGPHAFVFDRIVTHPDHRRKGLATAIMGSLAASKEEARQAELLVATEMGRPLYEKLG